MKYSIIIPIVSPIIPPIIPSGNCSIFPPFQYRKVKKEKNITLKTIKFRLLLINFLGFLCTCTEPQ